MPSSGCSPTTCWCCAPRQEVADETALRDRKVEVDAELQAAKTRESHIESAMSSEARDLARAQETWYRLSSVRERLRGTANIAAERQRHVREAEEETREGRDPEELHREAVAAREEQATIVAELDVHRAALAAVAAARNDAEVAHDEEQG